MKNFSYYTPTQVVFGRGSEDKVAEMVQQYGGTKVLLHYGGQSAVRSGLLQKVENQLAAAGIAYVTLGGVVPNPRLSLVHEGIALCRKEGVDFLLAVGGGSVIDSCKAIGYGVPYEGEVWDIYLGKHKPTASLPLGVVLTIPAAGSEMSDSSVITNEDGGIKLGTNSNLCRARFAIMDPERTYSLPAWQTACGVTDIIMHTMERYFSKETDAEITSALAEGLIRTLITEGTKVMADPQNYEARANIMWASSLSHNGLTGCGNGCDWATHKIEHELSGMFDVSHGAGLAAVWGSWARYSREENMARFVRFARDVMQIDTTGMSEMEASEAGIAAMEAFFRSLGMPTDIHTLLGREVTEAEMAEMAQKCTCGDTKTVGGLRVLNEADVLAIYHLAR